MPIDPHGYTFRGKKITEMSADDIDEMRLAKGDQLLRISQIKQAITDSELEQVIKINKSRKAKVVKEWEADLREANKKIAEYDEEIEEFLREHAQWLLDRLAEWKEERKAIQARKKADAERFDSKIAEQQTELRHYEDLQAGAEEQAEILQALIDGAEIQLSKRRDKAESEPDSDLGPEPSLLSGFKESEKELIDPKDCSHQHTTWAAGDKLRCRSCGQVFTNMRQLTTAQRKFKQGKAS